MQDGNLRLWASRSSVASRTVPCRDRQSAAQPSSRMCPACCAGVLLGVPGAAVRAVLPPGGPAGPRTQSRRRPGHGTQAAGTPAVELTHGRQSMGAVESYNPMHGLLFKHTSGPCESEGRKFAVWLLHFSCWAISLEDQSINPRLQRPQLSALTCLQFGNPVLRFGQFSKLKYWAASV